MGRRYGKIYPRRQEKRAERYQAHTIYEGKSLCHDKNGKPKSPMQVKNMVMPHPFAKILSEWKTGIKMDRGEKWE